MALADLVGELAGTLPGLDPLLAEKYINRAWSAIQDERRWSFLAGADGAVVCPTQLTSGTISITQFDAEVTCDAAASAALLPYTDAAAVPQLTQLQIRFGGSSTLAAGQIYNIMSADTTNPAAIVLTLNRIVVETTNDESTYQCYRCYVTPPDPDFLAWDSFVDMTYGFSLKLNFNSTWFDRRDPQRTAQGDAYYNGLYKAAPADDPNVEAGSPIYELWPHPTNGRTFYVRWARRGAPLVNPTDSQPAQISDELILARAFGWYAYPFAAANVANFPSMKNANWAMLIQEAKKNYRDELRAAKRNDDATGLQTVFNRGHGLRWGTASVPFPVDAAYIQGHLLSF